MIQNTEQFIILKLEKKDGTTKDIEVKSKGGNVTKYSRIRI